MAIKFKTILLAWLMGLSSSYADTTATDYLLSKNIALSTGAVLKAGTQWYKEPDIQRLKNELEKGTYTGDMDWAQKVVWGYDIMTNTYATIGDIRTDGRAPLYSGKFMNCSSCHDEGGIVPNAYPFFRTATYFGLRNPNDPNNAAQTGERYGALGYYRDTITAVKDCGINCSSAHIPQDSEEMDAVVAWIFAVRDGIYQGEGLINEFKVLSDVDKIPGARLPVFSRVTTDATFQANPLAGKKVYDRYCVSCHGKDGRGKWNKKIGYTDPPVAGIGSYTKAGAPNMVPIMASFIKQEMPPARPNSLTEQQAIDVAGYISTMYHESRWWTDYYFEHNPCGRPAFMPLDVGSIPNGYPFSAKQTQFGPWKPINDWLKSTVCTTNANNKILTPILTENFDAGYNGVKFVKPINIPEPRR